MPPSTERDQGIVGEQSPPETSQLILCLWLFHVQMSNSDLHPYTNLEGLRTCTVEPKEKKRWQVKKQLIRDLIILETQTWIKPKVCSLGEKESGASEDKHHHIVTVAWQEL